MLTMLDGACDLASEEFLWYMALTPLKCLLRGH